MQARKSLSELNREFNFNWNDPFTILDNKSKVMRVEDAIQAAMTSSGPMPPEEITAHGWLCYKLGTFYNYVGKNPKLALDKLELAQGILISPPEKIEIENHIAFANQQLFSTYKEQDAKQANIYKENAMFYCNKVITTQKSTPNMAGFAYAIRASIHVEAGELEAADQDYGLALSLYEKDDLINDNQYAITRNQYAQFLAAQKNPQAIAVFDELEKYWEKRKENEGWTRPNSLYANFLISYASSVEQNKPDHEQLVHMRKLYRRALRILKQTEGEDAKIVKKIRETIGRTQDELHATAALSPRANPALPTVPGITHFSPPPSPARTPRAAASAADSQSSAVRLNSSSLTS